MNRREAALLGMQSQIKNRTQVQIKLHDEMVAAYSKNPTRCKTCDIELPYENRKNKFCGHSCAAKYNNLGSPKRKKERNEVCLYCGGVIGRKNNKFCSIRCASQYRVSKRPFEERITPASRKKYLESKHGHRCTKCGLDEWLNDPIPLELDHIDGNPENNDESNFRLLCPNCHAQTDTYAGKNIGKVENSKRKATLRKYYGLYR